MDPITLEVLTEGLISVVREMRNSFDLISAVHTIIRSLVAIFRQCFVTEINSTGEFAVDHAVNSFELL